MPSPAVAQAQYPQADPDPENWGKAGMVMNIKVDTPPSQGLRLLRGQATETANTVRPRATSWRARMW